MLGRRDILALGAATGLLATTSVSAQKGAARERITLWPKGPPEPIPPGLTQIFTERSTNPAMLDRALKGVSAPWMEVVHPAHPNGAAIIAIPGGGYRHMAWDKEAIDVIQAFAAKGVTGFALAYRLPHDGWRDGPLTPLADAQRAVRIVRAQSKHWGIDPSRIAVVGFSAGGHLCANLAAHFDLPAYAAQDAVDSLSARPDLAAPVYPAIMVDGLSAALPKGQSLFGGPITDEVAALHSPHLHVGDQTPPHFLIHAEDDPLVGPDHTLALRAALVRAKIPAETHLYAKGGHGFGIRNTAGLPVQAWPEQLLAFGKTTGWII
jgi:acetyl esterase/lipase